MSSSDKTTVALPRGLHREVFGENGLKPYSSMSNAEFIEELADTYQRVKDI